METTAFVEGFVKGTLSPRKHVEGNFRIINDEKSDKLVYIPTGKDVDVVNRDWDDHNKRWIETPQNTTEVLAIRFKNGKTIYNANSMRYCGSHMAWGNRGRTWGQNDYQRVCDRSGAIGIPFTIFGELNMDPTEFRFIVTPEAETITTKMVNGVFNERVEPRSQHFVGALVFAIGDKYFLFDTDRKELDNYVLNPFIVELPHAVSSIQEAYDAIIPDEVKKATTPVLRQGEYFFICYGENPPEVQTITDEEKEIIRFRPSRFGFGASSTYSSYDDTKPFYAFEKLDTPEKVAFQEAALKTDNIIERITLSSIKSMKLEGDGSGSHAATKGIRVGDSIYVSGTVSHQRREHQDLVLTGWYKVMKNLALRSLQINGDVD